MFEMIKVKQGSFHDMINMYFLLQHNLPIAGTIGGAIALDFGFGPKGGNTGCILLMDADGREYGIDVLLWGRSRFTTPTSCCSDAVPTTFSDTACWGGSNSCEVSGGRV